MAFCLHIYTHTSMTYIYIHIYTHGFWADTWHKGWRAKPTDVIQLEAVPLTNQGSIYVYTSLQSVDDIHRHTCI
jgi:hypothetical protein